MSDTETRKKRRGTKDLVVREVKNLLPDIPLPRPIDDRLPPIPMVCLLVQKVRSGKSNLLVNMLLGENFYGGENYIFDMIYFISPTAKIDKTSQIYQKDEYKDRIIVYDDVENIEPFLRDILEYQSSFDIHDPDNLPPRIALVFDDISGYLRRTSLIAHVATRYRHYGIAALFISNQTLRDLPTQIRSQATSIILSSCYSTVERKKVIEEYGEFFHNNLEWIWDYACKERFNYLYLLLDSDHPRAFKLGKDGIEELDYKHFDEYLEDDVMVEIGGADDSLKLEDDV